MSTWNTVFISFHNARSIEICTIMKLPHGALKGVFIKLSMQWRRLNKVQQQLEWRIQLTLC